MPILPHVVLAVVSVRVVSANLSKPANLPHSLLQPVAPLANFLANVVKLQLLAHVFQPPPATPLPVLMALALKLEDAHLVMDASLTLAMLPLVLYSELISRPLPLALSLSPSLPSLIW